ncbi:flagellar motor switch protein FliN/FliY [Weissella beninensis]|uniref:Flagellar motor switch phosphatase FliY n=1 Tax=Periweissella beninensis TaxID=504936 RepID=A0ABT0VKH9_9LACO|nr:flagellar motor switch phosphatase FliY [Periweissella beninensis]MBM7544722.1 flagellar motor switch protein FliN/FliY [Periweissella beninensis]MCM2436960.1 flagellar motor switch phosphatase FliY [Periweissella beninensis]
MSDSLSQEEIDALMNGDASTPTPASAAPTQAVAPTSTKTSAINELDEQVLFDIIGEVGNISMSQAATTLSSILNRRVTITTPKVSKVKFADLLDGMETPKVATTVEFKEGLLGSNLMVLDVKDANIIANLMMGGEGVPQSEEFTEIELSAVAEAMNQMIGSASTSMSTMINRKVDILPPTVRLWKEPVSVEYTKIDSEEQIFKISFSLTVEGLIESEIMQIFSLDMVDEIADAMLSDKATVVETREEPREEPISNAPAPSIQASASTTSVEPQKVQAQAKQPAQEVNKPQFPTLEDNGRGDGDNLELILDVPLNLSVVLGRSQKKIRDILSLSTGSVVELDKLTDEPLEIQLNGKLIATGEVVVINENFGVRITSILSPNQRIRHMD